MHIAIVTAGGAGMFCGSCMHDNTWARALQKSGADVSLIPTYTPIRVDEEDFSRHEVFLGGINVYLEYRWRVWRRIPRPLTRWLDAPWVLNWAGRLGVSNDAGRLGALTLALLEGESGPHRREVDELADFLARQLKPDVICFTNALLSGALRRLKEQFDGPVYCVLQGDDIFLEALREPYRSRALQAVHERAAEFDRFLVHSRYYQQFMSEYLGIPSHRFDRLPLGIDLTGHDGTPTLRENNPFTIGYFARICPEKGLKQLVEAFHILHERQPKTRLKVGGYLGQGDLGYFREILADAERLGPAFESIGSPETLRGKVEFLKSLDVLSVPTVYHEPKGLYVLEALANGVPVVQPRHGAFPELIEGTGGGLLVEPGNAEQLAGALETLMLDPSLRSQLATAGHQNVRARYDDTTMAEATLDILQNALSPPEA